MNKFLLIAALLACSAVVALANDELQIETTVRAPFFTAGCEFPVSAGCHCCSIAPS
jgi:hypothetical protein